MAPVVKYTWAGVWGTMSHPMPEVTTTAQKKAWEYWTPRCTACSRNR